MGKFLLSAPMLRAFLLAALELFLNASHLSRGHPESSLLILQIYALPRSIDHHQKRCLAHEDH